MEEFFGEPIHTYTRQQAIEDGVLIHVGDVNTNLGTISICFTSNLFSDYRDETSRRDLIRQAIRLFSQPDEEDDGYRRMRVIDSDTWVIWDGDGITLLRPEDY